LAYHTIARPSSAYAQIQLNLVRTQFKLDTT
jgi:hypothetical protein